MRREPLSYVLPSIHATLNIESAYVIRSELTSRSQHYSDYFSLYPDSPKHLMWYQIEFRKLANLLTLLIGDPVYPEREIGYPPDVDEDIRSRLGVTVYEHGLPRRTRKRKSPREMLMPFLSIKDSFGEAVKHWFDTSDLLRDVHNLYFGSLFAPGSFLENEFLTLMQALESFSRTRGGGLYVSADDYKPIEQALVSAVPQGTNRDFRDSIKSRIKYMNEHSLRRRIDGLLKSLERDTIKLICPNVATFKAKVCDTRNYLTHWDKQSQQSALSDESLAVANQQLRLLLTILMLKEMCFEEEKIRDAIKRNPRWSSLIHIYLAKHED